MKTCKHETYKEGCRLCELYETRNDYRARMDAAPIKGLGDRVETALSAVGITPEKVEKWVGVPCGCSERKQRLNALGAWARQVMSKGLANAKDHLETLIRGD